MTALLTRLLALAELAVDEALQFEYGDPEDRYIWRELQEIKPLVQQALAQSEPQGPTDEELRLLALAEPEVFATLNWSEDRQPCEECRYNHCVAETPFGRFVVSWKGWKDHSAVTVDEAPFGEWFECWDSVEKAKSACQAEYNRRLAAAVGSSLPQPNPVRHSDGSLHQFMLRVGGKSFSCPCGCNVFHKPDDREPELYQCNCCNTLFQAL